MASVALDLQNNHTVVEIIGGVELTRVVRVTELVGTPDEQLLEALREPTVPQIGEFWPNEQWFVVRREAFPDGENAARIVLTYSRDTGSTFNQPDPVGNDGQDVKQFSASVSEETTTTDRLGAPMVIAPPAGWTRLSGYLSTATVLRPRGDVNFERTESSPPAARVRNLVGTLNAAAQGSYAARTLLFARLDAQSDDGGRLWRAIYNFRYNPNEWVHTDRWRDPTGRVPSNATDATFQVIDQADWTSLDLDWGDTQTPI